MEIVSFDMLVWTTVRTLTTKGPEALSCPACGSALALHQPEEEAPNRILATCLCEECSIWLALAFTPDRKRAYMIRIPSNAEFREVLARRGEEDGLVAN